MTNLILLGMNPCYKWIHRPRCASVMQSQSSSLWSATDCTINLTVSNSKAAQIIRLGVRAWNRTFEKFSSSPGSGVELLGNLVRAPSLASNFHLHNDADNRKFDCFGWKVTLCNFWGYYTKYYTFVKIHVSYWFIWVFDEPGFLLIRRSLVRAQVEEPKPL